MHLTRYQYVLLAIPLPTNSLAYDPEDEDVSWRVDELKFSGLDDLDAAVTQIVTGLGTAGPYTLDNPAGPAEICVRVNDVLLNCLRRLYYSIKSTNIY